MKEIIPGAEKVASHTQTAFSYTFGPGYLITLSDHPIIGLVVTVVPPLAIAIGTACHELHTLRQEKQELQRRRDRVDSV